MCGRYGKRPDDIVPPVGRILQRQVSRVPPVTMDTKVNSVNLKKMDLGVALGNTIH